ncbi:MAG: redoxin domain-containing protein, partial [Verrucomicrobiae bacterium]|nr:redoxin domain-containing protein [Verrucomicrobiae bacterium]
MAEVPSTFRLEPGSAAPDFSLPDGNGVVHSLSTLAASKQATVIVFACNHCPFVVHLADSLGQLARAQLARG